MQRASLSYFQREQQASQELRGEVTTWREEAEQNLYEINWLNEEIWLGQAVQQQMTQQKLVHVPQPQQEMISEHQRLIDQLLGVTPTNPMPLSLKDWNVEMRAQQPMSVGSQNAQVYDVASPRVVPQSRLKDRTRLPKLTLNMGMV
eukprot:626389-Amphidinium_carterae.1